jgi:UDP:flavonoid glycosyltransferase YjiC (YdhE family)
VNILLFALGSHGDVHPFVGIGSRLLDRGHDVSVAANPYFRETVEHAGLRLLPIGTVEQYRRLATSRDLWHPLRSTQKVFGGTAMYLRPMYDLAVEWWRQNPGGVIAASSLALGVRVAQDKHRMPVASVHLAPSLFLSPHAPPNLPVVNLLPRRAPLALKRMVFRGMHASIDALIGPPLNAFRAELGLPPVRGIIDRWWHSPQRVIGLFPEWFAPPQPDWPPQARLTGFPLFDEPDLSPISPQLEAFLRAGDPPIAFTPGSAMWTGHRFFDASVEACVRLERRGILLTRHADHLPRKLPEGVVHVHYAPFSRLLPRCAAFVHHGGIGSSAQALAAGVPQLVTPFTHDQPDNASRLHALGVASIVAPSKYDGERVARALRELIGSPRVARSCREVARKFDGVDPLGQTCELIESLGGE